MELYSDIFNVNVVRSNDFNKVSVVEDLRAFKDFSCLIYVCIVRAYNEDNIFGI